MLFFFSSRRRHTRCSRDWSSDVCSSDLIGYCEVRISIQIEIRDGDGRRVYPNTDRRVRSLLERNALSGGCRERKEGSHEQRKENDREARRLNVKWFHVGFPLTCHAYVDCA